MELIREGRVWKFGDNINTDIILPGAAFRLPLDEQHKLCFSAIRPDWVAAVRPGDIIIGGENFGMGSGRPVGATMRTCGIGAVVAESVNGLCLRNCIGVSLPSFSCPGVTALFEEGDIARIDFTAGTVENRSRGRSIQTKPLPPLLAEIVLAGGLVPMLAKGGWIEASPRIAATV